MGIVEQEKLYKQRQGSGEFGLLTERTSVGMEGKFSRQAPCPSEKRNRERERQRDRDERENDRKDRKPHRHIGPQKRLP